jgi:hypothetical protein
MSTLIRENYLARLILLAFIVLAVIYSFVTPPLEAGDESRHYAVVKYMADRGRLPVQEPGEAQIHWSHEGNQPPLYYGLAAVLTFWIDTGDWDDVYWYNPHTTIGNPLRADNKNITIHPPGDDWPWRGHVLAVHLIRFLSIGMAAITVATAYIIALSLFKGRRWPAAGAMAITAFNPMFIFISASVNNDNAVIMFVTLALGVMVQVAGGKWQVASGRQHASVRGEISSQPKFSRLRSPVGVAALLGLLIGLGALSKLYALGLIPLAGLFFFWLAYQNEGREASFHVSRFTFHAVAWSLTMLFVALLVAGWFYVRNAILYNGDFLALQVMRDTAGQRAEVPSLATLRAEFEGFRIAYWALFGGVNILVDNWIYTVLDWLSLIATIGLLGFLIAVSTYWIYPNNKSKIPNPKHLRLRAVQVSKISCPTFLLLLGWVVIMAAGFILWNLTQPAGQGRLLYPAIAAISALGMLGLTWWLPERGQRVVASLCIVGLFIFALLAPLLYIAPAYARPSLLTRSDLPADLQPLNFTYDGKMRLVGYQLHADTVRPAETVPLTLYWELLRPVDIDYSIFVHLLGRRRQVIGQIDTYPGGGKWPTTLLSPGDILADHYDVPIRPETEFEHAPAKLRIAAGIYDYQEPGRPGKPVTGANGQPVEPIIASLKLVPWQWPDPPRLDSPINFFDKVTLLSYRLAEDQQSVTLNWAVKQPLDTDYTVFLQAWDAQANEYATGFDGPPVQGDYPTSLWAPGEIIVDTHPLDLAALPPGDYYFLAGLYDPETGERLPAFGPDGPLPGYAVNLGSVEISEAE